MSGGAWDYDQYKLQYIADGIEDYIERNDEKPDWWDDEFDEWTGGIYGKDTMEEFKKAIAYLKIAEIYAQRADWLVSGDDGEEQFHERLRKDLAEAITTDKYGYVEKILNKEIL